MQHAQMRHVLREGERNIQHERQYRRSRSRSRSRGRSRSRSRRRSRSRSRSPLLVQPSAWVKYSCGQRAYYHNSVTRACSLQLPAEGVMREGEVPEAEAQLFEKNWVIAGKMDELQVLCKMDELPTRRSRAALPISARWTRSSRRTPGSLTAWPPSSRSGMKSTRRRREMRRRRTTTRARARRTRPRVRATRRLRRFRVAWEEGLPDFRGPRGSCKPNENTLFIALSFLLCHNSSSSSSSRSSRCSPSRARTHSHSRAPTPALTLARLPLALAPLALAPLALAHLLSLLAGALLQLEQLVPTIILLLHQLRARTCSKAEGQRQRQRGGGRGRAGQ